MFLSIQNRLDMIGEIMENIGESMDNTTSNSNSERQQGVQEFLDAVAETQRVNLVGLGFLQGIIDDHPDKVYIEIPEGSVRLSIIILGDLASYHIPTELLIMALSNPFTSSCGGLPPVVVQPHGGYADADRDFCAACIQPGDHTGIPGTDSIGILIAGLISDCDLFVNPTQAPFRRALLRAHGMIDSPVSDIFATYLDDQHGATIEFDEAEISIKGTHGFTWHLGGIEDPDVESFSLSSSIRGGPHRVHTADTYHCMVECDDLEYLLPVLSKAPRAFLQQESDDDPLEDLSRSKQILTSVAKVWAPLSRAIESGEVELEDDWSDDE
tara:strand:+ start:17 stop:994 length:978 start_codon:yes stop_codon:yes gene_type:complete